MPTISNCPNLFNCVKWYPAIQLNHVNCGDCPRTFPCKGKLFAKHVCSSYYQHRLPARPTAAWPVPYGGIGCNSCIGEQENVESRCERGGWISHRLKGEIWWTAMSGELLRELGSWWCVYLAHAYHRPLLPVLWFDDCEEKGEAQGSKTEILKGVFSFAFPLGFYAASPWQCEIAPLFAIWLGIALPDPNGVPSCMIQLDRRYIMCEGIVVDHYHTIYLCFSIFGPLLTKLRG